MAVWPLLVFYWLAQSQIWGVYNLWVRVHIVRSIGGFVDPVPWLLSLNGIAPLLLLPVCIGWWRWRARSGHRDDHLGRMRTGSLLLAAAMLWLALAPALGASGRAIRWWAVAFHFLSSLAGLCFIPSALALYAGTGPVTSRATVIAVSLLSGFVAGVLGGRLGGLYDTVTPATFWLVQAEVAAVPAAGLTLLARRLRTAFA